MTTNNSCDYRNPISVAFGGTGAQTFTADGILYGNGTSAISATAVGTANYALVSNGTGNAPTFQQVSLTAGVTGVLPIANGGTNASSMATTDGVVYYNGSSLVTTSAGTSTYVLTSNGAGNAPTFQAAAGGSLSVNIKQFTANGTYTPTTGMVYCIIEVWGGGGSGGGAGTTASTQCSVGGGGGAGGYSRGVYSATTIGSSQTVTIPGATAGNSGASGSSGGTCTVGSLIKATGGAGGSYGAGVIDYQIANGGTGGVGSLGVVNTYGENGAGGYAGITVGVWSLSGAGGASAVGQQGAGKSIITATGGSAGVAAAGYGSGGGGALNTVSQSAVAGGAGAPGLVIITEFI
jgi:hypothetical protein